MRWHRLAFVGLLAVLSVPSWAANSDYLGAAIVFALLDFLIPIVLAIEIGRTVPLENSVGVTATNAT